MKDPIQTHYVHPPIPDRRWDWCAYRDAEHRPVGWGQTEERALADLRRLEAEAECEARDCGVICEDCPVDRESGR